VRRAEETLAGGSESPETFKRARKGAARLCSFCYKCGTSKRALVLGPANICSDCVRICREILDGRAA
jgi:hypothetical protein